MSRDNGWNNWNKRKKEVSTKFDESLRKGLIDEKILPTLNLINGLPWYYTVSSCSGRVIILDLPEVGDKKNAVFRGRWHRRVEKDEVLDAIDECTKEGWFILNPPIIHVISGEMDNAEEILSVAIKSGFKRSGIKSIKIGKITVEINSTEVMETIVSKNGYILADDRYIGTLVEYANIKFDRFQKKIERLNTRLSELYDLYDL
ncbi:MAG TPA: hypothetical protein HA341_04940 [Halobacteria archaeon]|jgi:tRNA wybutosine-synthesizing protein 3|nr:hypothetical protein [Halobacteria archaeon]